MVGKNADKVEFSWAFKIPQLTLGQLFSLVDGLSREANNRMHGDKMLHHPTRPHWILSSLNLNIFLYEWDFPGGSDGKESACNVGDPGSIPGSRRSPGEGNGNPLHILAWKIPETEEPGGLPSMKSQRVGSNWATEFTCTSLISASCKFTFIYETV